MVGIYPNDASLIRLAGALLLEQNDEWLVGRRYLSAESLAGLYAAEQADEPRAAGAVGTGGGAAHEPMTLTTIRNYTTSGDLTVGLDAHLGRGIETVQLPSLVRTM